MIGSIRWSLAAAFVGFIGTFIASMPNNIISTSFIRSLYSSIFLFLASLLFRWFLGIIVRAGASAGSPVNSSPDEVVKGKTIDWATPEDDHSVRSKAGGMEDADAFVPLTPPKLATKENVSPEELAEALRHMSQE